MKKILFISILLSQFNLYAIFLKGDRIYFDFDKFTLTEKSKKIIDDNLKTYQNASITITGYADYIGDFEYNKILSLKRANAVKSYLENNGISVGSVFGDGENTFYDKNNLNRYVDIGYEPHVKPIIKKEKKILPSIDSTEISVSPDISTIQPVLNDISTLEVGQTLALPNLSFIPGRHFLMFGSEETLKQLVTVLKDNPTILIEIQGHICCMSPEIDGLDKDTQTMTLSVNRAEYVYNYLIKNGISPYRLTFKGYGASKPLVFEVTEEDRQKNRRVEIMIVDN